jgi:F0F1-type ATP synthase assembly protein I
MAKPSRTKVKLRRGSDQITIVVPRKQKLSKEAVHQVAFTLMIDLVATVLLGFAAGVAINLSLGNKVGSGYLFGLVLALIIGLWVLGMAFNNSAEMCKQLFSDTFISIDRKQLAISTQFWRYDWGTLRRIKVKDIKKIVITDFKYIEGINPDQAPCFLVLELDSGTVNLFGAEHQLSKSEAKWLGKELSRWLNIKFMVE